MILKTSCLQVNGVMFGTMLQKLRLARWLLPTNPQEDLASQYRLRSGIRARTLSRRLLQPQFRFSLRTLPVIALFQPLGSLLQPMFLNGATAFRESEHPDCAEEFRNNRMIRSAN